MKKQKGRGPQYGAVVCLGAVVLSGISGCGDSNRTGDAQAEPPKVAVFPIRRGTVTDYREWFGYLRGKQDTDIRPHVTGFLKSQEYTNGSVVHEGDVLFRIDPSVFEAELAMAKANLDAAQASVKAEETACAQSQLDVDRYTQLAGRAVAEKELADARQKLLADKAALAAAQARAEQCKASVDKAEVNLGYTVVRAPYDGIMGTAEVSLGELVSPATKLANIASVNPIRFDFSVNSDNMIDVFRRYGDFSNSGDKVKPEPPPAEIVLEDGTTFVHPGHLSAMESKVGDSGLIDVTGEVPNPELTLRGGMPVRVRIPLKQRDTFLVPQQSIRSVLRNDFIIVVDRQNHPQMVPVAVGGVYSVCVEEADGYKSTREMVAVSGSRAPLEDELRKLGYEKPEEAPVVADEANAVRAANISAANSRLGAKDADRRRVIVPTTYSFRPQVLPAAAAASGKAAAQSATAEATMPPVAVKVLPLLQQDVEVRDEWFGSLRGIEETDIRPQVSGFLLRQHFVDGAMVRKGDVLFTIDPALYKAAVQEAEANLLAAKADYDRVVARLENAKQDYERYSKLRATTPGAISGKMVTDAEAAVQTQRANLLVAQSKIAQTEANLRLAQINLDYTVVKAPFSGRVGIHKPSVGALVSPNDVQPLVTLSSVSPMRVDFRVSGRAALRGITAFESSAARSGADKPPFEVVLEDDSVYPHPGEVISADNTLDRSTGTLRVVGQVPNEDGALRSGMSVRVRAGMSRETGAFLVPARAPMNAQGRDIIVLMLSDGAPQMLPITKGVIVNIRVPGEDGKPGPLQPMQIIDVDRDVIRAAILAKAGASGTEEVVLRGAGVQDWRAFALKEAGVQDARALSEKQAGGPLPDDAPAKAGVADWDALVLQRAGAADWRGLVLASAGAKDELDLIARGRGAASVMELALRELGYTDMKQVSVVVEGSVLAAQAYAANMATGGHGNKLRAQPFVYNPPHTVVDSVTADAAGGTAVPHALPVPEGTAAPEDHKK